MGSNQAAQGFIQLGLENLQGGRLHNLSGQPAPLSNCPHRGKTFPYIQSETLSFHLRTFVSHSPTLHHCEEPNSISSMTPCRHWGAVRCPSSHLFSRLNQPSSPCLSSHAKGSSSYYLGGLPKAPPSLSISFLHCRAQNSVQYLDMA